jgi:acetate kinase
MKILVLNVGSSSIKYKLFDMPSQKVIKSKTLAEVKDYAKELKNILESIDENIDAYGHRVVHGGEKFHSPTLITNEVIKEIEELIPLAPLHNRANLEGIKISIAHDIDKPQIAIFDTAFHQSMPPSSFIYPLPYDLYTKHNIRRYGFHGTSHHFVAKEASKYLKKDLNTLNLITLHLGNGASATAIQNGKSIDTSMGFTPLEGLMMGTRSGDIDPAIIFYLHSLGFSIEQINTILHKESGLKGVCGESDLRKILDQNSPKSKLAIEIFTNKIKKYIGAYSVELGKVDAIIFTGGIGENSPIIREKVCQNLDISIGATLDIERNNQNIQEINTTKSKIKILVIKTDEELEIARESLKILNF